ncbi:MAG: FAD-dependent oxidoreductase [Candidatus Brocadiia bacterium]
MASSLPRRQFLKAASLAGTAGALARPAGAQEPQDGEEEAPMETIREEPRQVPVAHECDVCVVGGSCTGVFAAVAAARLGARVALIELNGFFGGVATASMVNVWHSLYDTTFEKQIIAGLTQEVIDRLARRDAIIRRGTRSKGVEFNSEVMKLELDLLVGEAGIRPFLHTMFAAPAVEDGRVVAAIIEDKTGRRAIRARAFVDATGDADLVTRMGLPVYTRDDVQPPTTCAILRGLGAIRREHEGFRIQRAIFDPEFPQALPKGFAWTAAVPGGHDETMLAGTRVFGADCSDADQLTRAELEGRRQVRAVCELLREHFLGGEGVPLQTLPARIGVRESRHARCLHELTTDEVLGGTRFPDAIANGSYRIDVHSARGAGVRFRDLKDTTFYQVPYRSLVPRGARNVLVAGRCLDADEGAFGAVRVMVNCNQMGQAAGAAAALALQDGADVADVEPARLRKTLEDQGAIVL